MQWVISTVVFPPVSAVKTLTIADDNHDYQGIVGAAIFFDNTGSTRFGEDATFFRKTGLFLPSVNIPQGASVDSFTLSFNTSTVFDGGGTGDMDYEIRAEASDNAVLITNAAGFQAQEANLTTAVAGETNRTFASGANETFIDFSNVIQEVVDRPGWVSGNAMALEIRAIAPTDQYTVNTQATTVLTDWTFSYTCSTPVTVNNCSTAVAEQASGGIAWTNPNSAITEDGSTATIVLFNSTSNVLRFSGFGFAIPATATITSLTVSAKIAGAAFPGPVEDVLIDINGNANLLDTSGGVTTTLTWFDTNANIAAWGNPTPADINSLNVDVTFDSPLTGRNGEIDALCVEVQYTA